MLKKNDYMSALGAARMVLKIDSNNAKALIYEAEALRGLERPQESLDTVNKFLIIKPASLRGLICKIAVLRFLYKPAEYEQTVVALFHKAADLLKVEAISRLT